MEKEPSPVSDPPVALVADWLQRCNSNESIFNRWAADIKSCSTDYDAIRRMLPLLLKDDSHIGTEYVYDLYSISEKALFRGLKLAVDDILARRAFPEDFDEGRR